jgi:hypothetical protein
MCRSPLSFITVVLFASPLLAAPGNPPTGYQLITASSGIASSSVNNIGQLTFKPGDSTHLYASRTFSNVVTRYDYNPTTAALSNPVNVLSLGNVSDGMKVITGIGFNGNDMWVSRWPGWVVPRPGALSRFRDVSGDGDYNDSNERFDAAVGLELGDHTFNEIQIVNNALYVGIGVYKNNGDPNFDQVYNGTIGRIGNLNSPVAVNLSTTTDRNNFANSSISDGRLRMYAKGFRNPYGVRVTSAGRVMVSDNGASTETNFPETPDLFYKDVKLNDVGRFPPPGKPGAETPTMTPLTVGMHSAPTGFDFIPSGPDRGKILVAMSANSTEGRKLVLIDPKTNAQTTFLTGFSTATDVYLDPYGRLLVSDLDGNAVYAITSPRDADANMDRKVDIADFKMLAQHWQLPATWGQGDFDRDGMVDVDDLSLLALNWDGSAASLASALAAVDLPTDAVPEPAALLALLAAFPAALRRPHKRP